MLRIRMQTFAALADPVRAQIVEMLSGVDLNAGDIAARFSISRPAVSRHLSVLLKSRLVRVRGEAQRRIYSLDPRGLDDASGWIDECRRIWTRRLDDLGRHLDATAHPNTEPNT
jgi:DNA-binding transcriptional ArsR family regulator